MRSLWYPSISKDLQQVRAPNQIQALLWHSGNDAMLWSFLGYSIESRRTLPPMFFSVTSTMGRTRVEIWTEPGDNDLPGATRNQ